MATTEISKYDDVIDSRDVIARIEELEGWRDDARATAEKALADIKADEDELHANGTPTEEELEAIEGRKDEYSTFTDSKGNEHYASSDWDEDAAEELLVLLALQDEASGSPDWPYGETLIRDSYFQAYAEELAEDCGMIPKDLGWPCNCIDWERATRELKMDYTSVEFDDVTYWIRS